MPNLRSCNCFLFLLFTFSVETVDRIMIIDFDVVHCIHIASYGAYLVPVSPVLQNFLKLSSISAFHFFHLLQSGTILWTLPHCLFCFSEPFLVLGWSCLWGLMVVCLPSLPLVSMLLTYFWKWIILCSQHFSHVDPCSPCNKVINQGDVVEPLSYLSICYVTFFHFIHPDS